MYTYIIGTKDLNPRFRVFHMDVFLWFATRPATKEFVFQNVACPSVMAAIFKWKN